MRGSPRRNFRPPGHSPQQRSYQPSSAGAPGPRWRSSVGLIGCQCCFRADGCSHRWRRAAASYLTGSCLSCDGTRCIGAPPRCRWRSCLRCAAAGCLTFGRRRNGDADPPCSIGSVGPSCGSGGADVSAVGARRCLEYARYWKSLGST